MLTTLEQIRKRDGRIVPFDPQRIARAIAKATKAVHGADDALADALAKSVVDSVTRQCESGLATVEQIQDAIEAVLIEAGLSRAAKAFILYRARRSRIREGKSELMLAVNDLLSGDDPVESPRTPAGKVWEVGSAASQEYYLKRLIPEPDAVAHMRAELHVEALDSYATAPDSLVFPMQGLFERGLQTAHATARPSRDGHAAARLVALGLSAASAELSGSLALDPFDRDLGAWLEAASDAELSGAVSGLLETLALSSGRADAPVPVAIAFGADPAPAARRVARALLEAAVSMPPLVSPMLVMRVAPGVNLAPQDPNHDLLQQAVALASRRMNPLFAFGDAPVLGSGARLAGDRFGMPHAGRGVIAGVTVNLPRIALLARRDHQAFDAQLMQVLDRAARHLSYRMHVLSQLKARELPQLMAQGLHLGTEGLAPHDPVGVALRHGQLNIGFVGLAEALTFMEGAHHGERSSAQERGLAMVRLMRDTVAGMAERHDLNIVLSGQPSDEAALRFVSLDRRDFGCLPGITDRVAYTPSFWLPTDLEAPAETRIACEAPYHALCPGGHASILELAAGDTERLLALLPRMHAEGMGLMGVSFPLDACPRCGEASAKPHSREACPCGEPALRRIRRKGVELALWERLGEDRQAEILRRGGCPPSV